MSSRSHLSAGERARLESVLTEHLEEQRAQLEQNEGVFGGLAADNGADANGYDRELARVAGERIRQAIEETQSALARLSDGIYGICQSCGRRVSLERLEAIPQVRFCVACARPDGTVR
ncbi:MAG TPA: TraR/DksA C4-type zinc finger protein [Acidimicrobiales bacterium]|nr:TraR/DksA C4-type zinc finger protein [Acidimicrobiales bacterium]